MEETKRAVHLENGENSVRLYIKKLDITSLKFHTIDKWVDRVYTNGRANIQTDEGFAKHYTYAMKEELYSDFMKIIKHYDPDLRVDMFEYVEPQYKNIMELDGIEEMMRHLKQLYVDYEASKLNSEIV